MGDSERMAERHEVVPQLSDAVEARRNELKLTPGKLHKAVGFATTTVDNIRKGYRRAYADDVKWAVCDALDWTPDSIDRLLRGEEPVVRPEAPARSHSQGMGTTGLPPELVEALAALESRLARVVEQIDVRVSTNAKAIARLERRLSQREAGGASATGR